MASWELVLAMGGGSWIHHPIVPARHGGSSRYAQCDLVHFFEIFSLELEQDYVNALGTKGPKANPLPAMTTHRIMNTLMGHIHNLMDAESIDMFQMIVLREPGPFFLFQADTLLTRGYCRDQPRHVRHGWS